jgi:hypothetical protein
LSVLIQVCRARPAAQATAADGLTIGMVGRPTYRPLHRLEDPVLLLFLLLPTALLLMLRGLERYERMIDAPPRKARSAATDEVAPVGPVALTISPVEPAGELA